jgi:hypothetical protein
VLRAASRTWPGATVVALLSATLLVLGHTEAAFHATSRSQGNQWTAARLLAPGTPTATYSCALTTRTITVSWSASPSTFTTRYRIERSVNGAAYAFAAEVAFGTNTWTDPGITGSTTYAYRVRGERAGTTWVSAYTAASGTVTTPVLCV